MGGKDDEGSSGNLADPDTSGLQWFKRLLCSCTFDSAMDAHPACSPDNTSQQIDLHDARTHASLATAMIMVQEAAAPGDCIPQEMYLLFRGCWQEVVELQHVLRPYSSLSTVL